MFIGEFRHALDPKGRVILPASFREQLQEEVVMTYGIDGNLTLYSTTSWSDAAQELGRMRQTDKRERRFARMMMAGAHAERMDRQGRITVPARLREYAGLDRDVVLLGQLDTIEIWDAAAWEVEREEATRDFRATDRPFDVGGRF